MGTDSSQRERRVEIVISNHRSRPAPRGALDSPGRFGIVRGLLPRLNRQTFEQKQNRAVKSNIVEL